MNVKKFVFISVVCLILVLAGPVLLNSVLGTDEAVIEAAYAPDLWPVWGPTLAPDLVPAGGPATAPNLN